MAKAGQVLKSAQQVRQEIADEAGFEPDPEVVRKAETANHTLIDIRDHRRWIVGVVGGPYSGAELVSVNSREEAIAFAKANGLTPRIPSMGVG